MTFFLARPIGWNNLQGIFRDHLILCVLSWADWLSGNILSPLSVCQSGSASTDTSKAISVWIHSYCRYLQQGLHMTQDSSPLTHQIWSFRDAPEHLKHPGSGRGEGTCGTPAPPSRRSPKSPGSCVCLNGAGTGFQRGREPAGVLQGCSSLCWQLNHS